MEPKDNSNENTFPFNYEGFETLLESIDLKPWNFFGKVLPNHTISSETYKLLPISDMEKITNRTMQEAENLGYIPQGSNRLVSNFYEIQDSFFIPQENTYGSLPGNEFDLSLIDKIEKLIGGKINETLRDLLRKLSELPGLYQDLKDLIENGTELKDKFMKEIKILLCEYNHFDINDFNIVIKLRQKVIIKLLETK